ncbi:---NA--- [Octopus vulgaris]|uniref:---NA n=1 Tax=Octopus vulgaris TaxID=6645 RepID=A0AA36B346_OCTVU|nr:---NA--- [Octopus vulgaris]
MLSADILNTERSVCDKSFSVRSHLNKHKFIHRRAKSYHCDICDKSFFRSCGLSKHKCTHTGERVCRCKICGKSF